MDKREREQLRDKLDTLTAWRKQAEGIAQAHARLEEQAQAARSVLTGRTLVLARAGRPAWQALPLEPADLAGLTSLAGLVNRPTATAQDVAMRDALTGWGQDAVRQARSLLGLRRFVAGQAGRAAATAAAGQAVRLYSDLLRDDVASRLSWLGHPTPAIPVPVTDLRASLDERLGLVAAAGRSGHPPLLIPAQAIHALQSAAQTVDRVLAGEAGLRGAAQTAGDVVRQSDAHRMLQEMPADTLKTVTSERLPLGALERAGISNVAQVLSRGRTVQQLPGIGELSARRIVAAARSVERGVREEMPVRIDVVHRHPETTRLLQALQHWDASRQTRGAAEDLARLEELRPLTHAVSSTAVYVLLLATGSLSVDELLAGVRIVEQRAQMLRTGSAGSNRRVAADPWEDFLARPADYFAMLNELGFVTEDEEASHGDLPEEIVDAVRAQPLDGEHLNASLRGYQSFAARFALVQRKVIIGDEMGLGKTVEAIAVLAHLRSRGKTHFVVVCPAAVVVNWVREVASKSRLRAHRVHGPDRAAAAKSWVRTGGVAVTTFETLAWWNPDQYAYEDIACVVVDEAHYAKNPLAKRSERTAALIEACDRAVLLTGTPLENRLEEFRTLVSYLDPDLARRAPEGPPMRFRRHVAPAYLRRNQEDVLDELPELVAVQEWGPMSASDQRAYDAAVGDGNWMAMRRAAMLQGENSTKVDRLIEIVREAEANDRRLVIFSYFRDVLDELARLLPGQIFGPITGSVPPDRRQGLIDDFGRTKRGGAVLLSQISAGGTGLNIQAASVVVICEPQLKPSLEAQAIARAHRMGQVRSVQVHRLLSEDSVDERLTRILAEKTRIFDDYARLSSMADATPESVDLSDADLVRQVIADERRRLAERRGEDVGDDTRPA